MNKKLSSVTEHLWGEVHSLKAPCESLPSALWEPIEWAPSLGIYESEIRSGKKHIWTTHTPQYRGITPNIDSESGITPDIDSESGLLHIACFLAPTI